MTASKNLTFANDSLHAFTVDTPRFSASTLKASLLRIASVEGMLSLASASSVLAVAFYAASNFLGA